MAKIYVRAAIVSTCSWCQKTNYNTPFTDLKFEGSIHAICKCMNFLLYFYSSSVGGYELTFWRSRFPHFLLKNTYRVFKVIHKHYIHNITGNANTLSPNTTLFCKFKASFLHNEVVFAMTIVEILIMHIDY